MYREECSCDDNHMKMYNYVRVGFLFYIHTWIEY